VSRRCLWEDNLLTLSVLEELYVSYFRLVDVIANDVAQVHFFVVFRFTVLYIIWGID
jgi:hypothetical protein